MKSLRSSLVIFKFTVSPCVDWYFYFHSHILFFTIAFDSSLRLLSMGTLQPKQLNLDRMAYFLIRLVVSPYHHLWLVSMRMDF